MSYKPLGLEDLMPFGKHKGTKIRVLLMNEIAYMKWLMEQGGNFQLDNKAFEKYEEQLDNL